MPMIMKCKLCDFEGNHGFTHTNGGLFLYHAENKDGTGQDKCSYYIGDDGKVYKTALDLFLNVTAPRARKDGRTSTVTWIHARIADLTNHPRTAKRLYKQWQEAINKERR